MLFVSVIQKRYEYICRILRTYINEAFDSVSEQRSEGTIVSIVMTELVSVIHIKLSRMLGINKEEPYGAFSEKKIKKKSWSLSALTAGNRMEGMMKFKMLSMCEKHAVHNEPFPAPNYSMCLCIWSRKSVSCHGYLYTV